MSCDVRGFLLQFFPTCMCGAVCVEGFLLYIYSPRFMRLWGIFSGFLYIHNLYLYICI